MQHAANPIGIRGDEAFDRARHKETTKYGNRYSNMLAGSHNETNLENQAVC